MKIQCACGAKYSLDVVPGMPPVTFVCPACGQDYSAFVNDLIRKELGEQAPAATPPAASAAPPPPPAAPAAPEGSRLRISRAEAPAAAPQEAPISKYCPKHRTELATDNCQICKKPICPKCIETFGPFCSAFCRNKVEGPSMNAPVHIGQRLASQHVYWRKVGLVSKIVAVLLLIPLGIWFWYAWIGSQPKVVFSIRWDVISHSGSSRIVNDNDLVFLHGGTLARYNLQTKQKVWSLDLVSPQEIADVLKQQDEEKSDDRLLPPAKRQKYARIDLEQEFSLHGNKQDVWVAKDNTLTHYDWNNGNVVQQIVLTNGMEDLTDHGAEFLALGRTDNGVQTVTHIGMDDGQMRTEEFSGSNAAPAVVAQNVPGVAPQGGGLPISRNGHDGALNPRRVANQAQNMSLPGRLALPALIANSEHNRQISDEMRQEDNPTAAPQSAQAQARMLLKVRDFKLVPDGDSYIGFGLQMTKENIIEREAMKAPPRTSALNDANLSTANEGEAVNEQLNEIQRNNGGDKVVEDQSEYQVAVRRPGSEEPDWVGTVIGPPHLMPLESVNVIAAGKTIIVLNKSNKQLWQAQLTYDVTGSEDQTYESTFGAGPCVEHNGVLYVFDQAVLTAYDPTTGNVHWRIPSVGVVGLFFDDKGAVYVNTTSGNPDDIKYSRQIDITKQTQAIVLKVDAATGNILWKSNPGGYISYLSGKFIYAYQSFDPGDEEDENSDALQGLEKPPLLRIIRINPDNGHTMWWHDEPRAPVDVNFDRNTISVVLKKEVEVLHFFSF